MTKGFRRGAMALRWVLAVSAVAAGQLQAQDQRTVTGVLRVAGDTAGVNGALVIVLGTGTSTVTDAAGRFSFLRPNDGPLALAISALGFRPDTVSLAADADTLEVRMVRAPIQLAPLEVERGREIPRARFEDLAQLSTITLGAPELRRVPSVLEPDVLRAIQLLPGTVAKNDFSIGFNVRGGEDDQNLIQLDGIPVFNPTHLAGLFSTFDTDAISQTDFLTGGFPAGYSGRLSSVLDIQLRDGDSTRVRGAGQVSLLSSKLLLEGPLPGRASFLVSARRTYMDAVVKTFTSYELPYYFTDLLAKATLPTGAGKLSVTGYWGRDALSLNLVDSTETADRVDLDLNWGNRLLGASWQLPVGNGILRTRASLSNYTTTLGLIPDLVRYDNAALLLTGASALSFRPWTGHHVEVGGSVERYQMRLDLFSPALDASLMHSRYRTAVISGFVDEQWSPSRRVLLRPGVRVEHVPQAGFTGFSPRVAAKFFLTKDMAITGSAGRYFQPVHSIRDQEFPITIWESWISADRNVAVAKSDHVVLGIEAWFARDIQVTLEGYRKTFANLASPNPVQDLRKQGDEFDPATGVSSGFDFLLRKHAGLVRGWVAYTFGTARRTVGDLTYPPAHDRRHTLNIVVQMPGPLRSAMAVRWGYGSPLPYTAFVGEWEHRRYNPITHAFDDSNDEPVAGPRNGSRYPYYTRLDAGLRWTFRKWGVTWEPYLQAVNLYNRRNVFLYFFDYKGIPPTRTGLSQMPLLPTFGLELRF